MDTAERAAFQLLDIGRAAAAVLMQGFRSDVAVEHKGTIDLVTAWDRASEAVIRDAVAQALPSATLVAEESAGSAIPGGLVVWADPLDGTTNFVHGHPFFAVSLALADGAALLAAAVVAPALGVAWHAAKGGGAFRNGAPCRVSATADLQQSLLATGFPYDNPVNPQNNFAEFAALTKRSRGVRRCGSAALDLSLVADGTFDGYWERFLKPWDLAAGALLVAEAGGTTSNFSGGAADFRDGALVASNGRVHPALLAALGDAARAIG